MPAAAPGGEPLSSAILYAAIIAIWAGVLIPRWLRRDTSAGSSDASGAASSGAADSDAASSGAAASGASGLAPDEAPAVDDGFGPRRRRKKRRADVRPAAGDSSGDRREAPQDLARRRVLAGRRRLLGLLVLLAAGSGALAGTRMAAWWVVVPPFVMLLGYLPLLRAAAQADAERRALTARRRMAGGQLADYSYSRSRGLADPVVYEAQPADPVYVRGPAPAPPAEVSDTPDDEAEIYDQYADAKLRAVGD